MIRKKTLVMMDVEGDNVFYEQKSFMCQFLKGSLCYLNSVEGKIILRYLSYSELRPFTCASNNLINYCRNLVWRMEL